MTEYDRRDSRLRVIYDNGTESNLLMRSLRRVMKSMDRRMYSRYSAMLAWSLGRPSRVEAWSEDLLDAADVVVDVDDVLDQVEASDDARAVAPADIALLAVKLYDAEAAAEAMRPLLKPGGRAIFQVYNRISWLNAQIPREKGADADWRTTSRAASAVVATALRPAAAAVAAPQAGCTGHDRWVRRADEPCQQAGFRRSR